MPRLLIFKISTLFSPSTRRENAHAGGDTRASLPAHARVEGVMRSRAGGGRRTADPGTLGAWPNAIELIIRSIKQG
jgi:hypothetical protein